jgi:hypothetical protein
MISRLSPFILSIFLVSSVASDPGTTFTYQGRLADGSTAIEVPVDLRFCLFDDPTTGGQIGPIVEFLNTAYDGGIVQRDLDFGAGAFNGDPRWLEIKLANPAGDVFTTLTPRIQILPTPYAMYAETTGSAINDADTSPTNELNTSLTLNGMNLELEDAGGVLSADLSPLASSIFGDGHSLDAVDGAPVDAVFVDADGQVGIGTTTPSEALEVQGSIQLKPTLTLDQSQLSANLNLLANSSPSRQSFTPSITGVLGAIEVQTAAINNEPGGTLSIFDGPDETFPLLASQPVTLPVGAFQRVVFNIVSPPNVVAGQMYTFEFLGSGGGNLRLSGQDGNPYPDGSAIDFAPDVDHLFQTFVFPSTADGIRFADGTFQTTAFDGIADGHSLNAVDGDPVDALFVDADGEVGIGTTAPIEALEVDGIIYTSPASVIDQQLESGSGAAALGNVRQSFTAGISGLLTSAGFGVLDTNTAGTGTMNLYLGEGTVGSPLATEPYSFPINIRDTFEFSFSNPASVVAGQQYTIQFLSSSGGHRVDVAGGDLYPDGRIFGLPATVDLIFLTRVAPDGTGGVRFPDNTIQTTAFSGSTDDADADPTNELNTSLALNGMNLELTDAGGTLTADLSPLAGTTFGDGHSLDAMDGSPVDVVKVDNEGRVGIGTTTPSSLLEVSGDITLTQAVSALDQSQLVFDTPIQVANARQSFQAGISGSLTAIEMEVFSGNLETGGALSIYDGPDETFPLLTSQPYTLPTGVTQFVTFNLISPPTVVAGQSYTFRFQGSGAGNQIFQGSNSDPYPDGQIVNLSSADFIFQTFVGTPPSGIRFSDSSYQTTAFPGNVDDADADPANEIQTLSFTSPDLTISGTGGNTVDLSSLQDGVNDPDADPANELITATSLLADRKTLRITEAGATFDVDLSNLVPNVGAFVAKGTSSITTPTVADYAPTGVVAVTGTIAPPLPDLPTSITFEEFEPVATLTASSTNSFTVDLAPIIMTIDSSTNDVGQWNSLAVVDGHPAVSYYDATAQALLYQRANDAVGSSWGTPIVVDIATGNAGRFSSLAVIDGRPAIAYQSDVVRYVRANDAQGASWAASIDVGLGNANFPDHTLIIADGFPAIGIGGRFVRATDAQGAAWDTPLTGIATGRFGHYAVIGGIPSHAGARFSPFEVIFSRGTDAQATGWSAGTIVQVAASFTAQIPREVDGLPAVGYVEGGGGSGLLRFTRATNAAGTAWGTPIVVAGSSLIGNPGRDIDLEVFGTIPSFARVTTSNVLQYIESNDAQGSSWGSPTDLDNTVTVGSWVSMAEHLESRAFTYYDTDNGDLRYAFFPTPSALNYCATIGLDINDADPDPTNEIQTLSGTGSAVTLSNNGGTVEVSALSAADGAPDNVVSLQNDGDVVVDTNTLFVDISENRVGMGENAPVAGVLDIQTTSLDAADDAVLDQYHLLLRHEANADNEEVGIGFRISSDAGSTRVPGAAITHERTGAQSVGSLHFKTSPSQGTLTTRMTIASDGGIFASSLGTPAGNPVVFLQYDTVTNEIIQVVSSEQFKENIEPVKLDTEKILDLQPVTYSYKNGGGLTLGYIAEQLHELGLTQLVIYDAEGKPYSIAYDLIPLFQNELIKKHEKRLAEKDAELQQLREDRDNQQKQIDQLRVELEEFKKLLKGTTE